MQFIFRNIEDVLALYQQGVLFEGIKLGDQFYTSDFVIASHASENVIAHIVEKGLIVIKSFSGIEMINLGQLLAKCNGLVPADCSVLLFATVTGATVITSEKIILRECAKNNINAIIPENYIKNIKQYERK